MRSFGILFLLIIIIYLIYNYKLRNNKNVIKNIEYRYIPYSVYDQLQTQNLNNIFKFNFMYPLENNDLSPWRNTDN